MQHKATTYLKSLERRLSSLIEANNHLFITSSIIASFSVTQTILEIGETCSMLAMTPYERDGVAHVLMDSITERVLQRTKLPTLIIKPLLYEMQTQPVQPKEVLMLIDDMDDGEYFAWSLPGRNIGPSSCFYAY
jgi:hypothetical protein